MHLRIELEKHRKENPRYVSLKNPREHQKDAFEKLSGLFTFKNDDHKSGILVLPTGAGKTFTAVRWICKNVLPKNVKVLWLAHTGHLLDQAYETLKEDLLEIPPSRNLINIRVVSSASEHATASSIEVTDDILIMTTQTAISNFENQALDSKGEKRKTAFEKFIDSSKKERLFVVLDEAHHAPAYGCRNLLIGGSKFSKGIRQIVPNSYFLGLTATPSYSDERRRGWLWEIFKDKIIYEAQKTDLTEQNILAVPNYIQRNTEKEIEVDDVLYDTLVRQHKDLPEDLIERLANDSGRNDKIVEEYLSGKYGKTLIFADRWFQCVYIKEKLNQKAKERGIKIKADAVYSSSSFGGTVEERNRRTSEDNSRILRQFKNGELDVLVNVKMLTEGTDVPDVKTVFITRETTSSILLTQMIGRALRGKGAGGGEDKKVANIVFFVDNWKRVINFATADGGGIEEKDIIVRGSYPMEFISIKLIEELSRKIERGLVFSNAPFLDSIPVGWYETQTTVTVDENTASYKEFVIAFEKTKSKFEKFIKYTQSSISQEWEDDALDDAYALTNAQKWAKDFFNKEDNANNTLEIDLIKIARHIAQNKTAPNFFTFLERDKHDLSQIAKNLLKYNQYQIQEKLQSIFNDNAFRWQSFYKSYDRFKTSFDAELNRIYHIEKFGKNPISIPDTSKLDRPKFRELTEVEKNKVLIKDSFTCQACGKTKEKGRKVKLQIDHIIPFKFGGESSIANSQTLCSVCNSMKGVNEINFRVNMTPLKEPQDLKPFLKPSPSQVETPEEILKRIINMFYHCQAVSHIKWSSRAGNKYSNSWTIELYDGNNPQWLKKEKKHVIFFVQKELGYSDLKNIEIV